MVDSDEESEGVEPNPLDIPDLRDATLQTLEHRHRNSIRAYQRFLAYHYRIDETIELTNAHVRIRRGVNQANLVGDGKIDHGIRYVSVVD